MAHGANERITMAERTAVDNLATSRIRVVEDLGPLHEEDAASRTRPRATELGIGLALVLGGALLALMAHRAATDEVVVAGAARDLARGDLVVAADLRAIEVPAEIAGAFVLAEEARTLVGLRAVADVAGGAPLQRSQLAAEPPLGAEEALVGVRVRLGHYPEGLARGDAVRVVTVPPPGATGVAAPTLVESVVTVWAVTPPDEFGDDALVTLRGPLSLAGAVAGAEQVRLAAVAP
jgi:hypothetical protein